MIWVTADWCLKSHNYFLSITADLYRSRSSLCSYCDERLRQFHLKHRRHERGQFPWKIYEEFVESAGWTLTRSQSLKTSWGQRNCSFGSRLCGYCWNISIRPKDIDQVLAWTLGAYWWITVKNSKRLSTQTCRRERGESRQIFKKMRISTDYKKQRLRTGALSQHQLSLLSLSTGLAAQDGPLRSLECLMQCRAGT